MVGYLANAILSQTIHANASNSVKLSLAALLHDVGIKQDITWDLEKSDNDDDFSVREVEVFKGHMFNSVDVLNKFDDMPMDIDKIILQHHEKYDGSGYPRGIGWSKIPFLVSVFIVAHETVIHLFNTEYSEEALTQFIALKKNEYKEGSFKEVVLALEKIR
jgi:response regulator RpfG family c-di-GMP phosphodiesterase